MPNSANEALAFARREHDSGTSRWPALCLAFVRTCFGVSSYFPSARDAWYGAEHKHRTSNYKSIPRGVPVYWLGGSQGYGHIALSAGNGMCWSNDVVSYGRIHLVSMESITRNWNQSFQGWTEDINRVQVWDDERSPWSEGTVYLSKLHKGQIDSDSVRRLKYVLKHKTVENGGSPHLKMNGSYGRFTVDAVSRWQKKVAEAGINDGTVVPPFQAKRLFGDKYTLIDDRSRRHRR